MNSSEPKLQTETFGEANGKEVNLYTLSNAHLLEARITNYGAALVSLKVPDHNGKLDDVVLGCDELESYLSSRQYLGAVVGRYGNRIHRGRFTLDGTEYCLTINDGKNHLHGGTVGFDRVVWDVKAHHFKNGGPTLELTYLSVDGEQGYPGTLTATVIYTLTNGNELKLEYFATTNRDTIVNLTNHSYFNLAGEGNSTILNHHLMIAASRFTPVDAELIPTGELLAVEGTPFDFTELTPIGRNILTDNEQLQIGTGFDHNWVLEGELGQLRLVASVFEPVTRRAMEVWTTQPGLQFYSGNYLQHLKGKRGHLYEKHHGFSLEAQHFPDSPNHTNFPSTVLKAAEHYHHTTIYKFSVT